MSLEPKVSVVMPVHNGSKFIGTAIQSILNQTYPRLELIIVDDGSSDETGEVVARFRDERILILKNPVHAGLVPSLNRGLKLASGKYIARLDSDDVALPQRLQKQVDFLESMPDYGLIGSWMETFGERNMRWQYPQNPADFQLAMLFRNPLGHSSVMYRARWQDGQKGFYDPDFETAEDFELWSRLCLNWKCARIPEVLTLYRTHSAQATKTDLDKRRQAVRRIVTRHRAALGVSLPEARWGIRESAEWWGDLELLSEAGSRFHLARFDRERLLQNKIYFWEAAKGILGIFGLATVASRLRNQVERVTHCLKLKLTGE